MTKITVVNVMYHNGNGCHVFTSDDVKGLFISSCDCERAFNDVVKAIELLMEANYGIICTAVPLMTFEEFLSATGNVTEESPRSFELKMAA